MKNIILLFIFFIPASLFAQYPATGNKQRLGYQTTGDGLIWRGVAADTAIKPRTINNAYFQLDTVNRVLRRYIATQGSWQVVGGTPDLSAYLEIADTAAMLSNYPTFGDISTALGDYLPIEGGTLTGTGGAGFIGFPSQVVAPGTPASGLNVFASGSAFNWKGTDGHERQFASTLTGGRTYMLPDVSGTFALGTGTADRSARWSATNTLAAGNFTDNGTKIEALLPFQFQSWTTAGRPTGVNGYTGFNTSFNWLDIYSSSGWFSPARAATTGGAFTAGYIPFGGTGGLTESGNISWDNTNRYFSIGSLSSNVGNGGTVSELRFINSTNIGKIKVTQGSVGGNDMVWEFIPHGIGSLSMLTLSSVGGTGTTTSNVPFLIPSSTNYLSLGQSGGSNAGIRLDGSIAKRIRLNSFYVSLEGNTNEIFQATDGTNVKLRLVGNGNLLLGTTTDVTGYNFNIVSTGAMTTPRGTVAQRPTIASNTTPFRYNTDSTALEYGESVGTWRQIATRAYARSLVSALPTTNIYTANGTLTSNRTLSSGGFTLNLDTDVGISTTPTQDLDVNGDAYIRDSTRLTTTPAHSAITGLLTRDANGWVGSASLAGGLSYSGGVLSASGVNTVYTASDSIRGDRYLEMANNGSATTALGYFPNFPSLAYNAKKEYGLYISPTSWGGNVLISSDSVGSKSTAAILETYPDNLFMGVYLGNSSSFISQNRFSTRITSIGEGTSNNQWNLLIDSLNFSVRRRVGTVDYDYNLLPNNQIPSATSTSKTVLQWTGDGSNANPAFVEVKRDTTIYVTDADYNFGTAISSANVLLRYNRVFIYSKLTASATSDNQIILPSASTDFLQCSIYVFSNDASADADATSVDFTTNGAVDGAGGTLSSYALTGGQQILIRPTNDGGYKWFFN